jgi:hypothetical protein
MCRMNYGTYLPDAFRPLEVSVYLILESPA